MCDCFGEVAGEVPVCAIRLYLDLGKLLGEVLLAKQPRFILHACTKSVSARLIDTRLKAATRQNHQEPYGINKAGINLNCTD